jgi:hypothetical protein
MGEMSISVFLPAAYSVSGAGRSDLGIEEALERDLT